MSDRAESKPSRADMVETLELRLFGDILVPKVDDFDPASVTLDNLVSLLRREEMGEDISRGVILTDDWHCKDRRVRNHNNVFISWPSEDSTQIIHKQLQGSPEDGAFIVEDLERGAQGGGVKYFPPPADERHPDFDCLAPYAEAYGGELRDRLGKPILFGAVVDGKGCQIECLDGGKVWMITTHGARPLDLPEKKTERFKLIDPADWHGQAIPERAWYIDGMIPGRQVTLLSGDGGTGKSLLAYQIGIAGALGVETLGLHPASGGVLYLAAEDDEEELIRRGHDILSAMGRDFADLKDRMRVMPMAGLSAELVHINPERRIERTDLAAKVEEIVKDFDPILLILDTSADVFGGDEINRVQVRYFVSMLRRMAMDHDMAVLLLSHPSVAGMTTGTGLSGSTAWNNSVRARLYLTADKDDDDLRILKGMKANYARKGGEIKLRWHEGAFILDDGKPSPGIALVNNNADAVFLKMLSAINASGRRVSSSKSTAYAPTVMAAMPESGGVSKKSLMDAMARLFTAKKIAVVREGPPSKQRERLVVVEDEIRQKRMPSDQPSDHVPTDFQPLPTGVPSNPLIPPVGLEHPTRLEVTGSEIQPPANDNIVLEENAAPMAIQEAA